MSKVFYESDLTRDALTALVKKVDPGFSQQLIPDDGGLSPLYNLLIDESQEVRREAGEFVYEHLIAQKFNSSPSSLTGCDDSSSETHILKMLKILREFSTNLILSGYVIDDVWEYMKAVFVESENRWFLVKKIILQT